MLWWPHGTSKGRAAWGCLPSLPQPLAAFAWPWHHSARGVQVLASLWVHFFCERGRAHTPDPGCVIQGFCPGQHQRPVWGWEYPVLPMVPPQSVPAAHPLPWHPANMSPSVPPWGRAGGQSSSSVTGQGTGLAALCCGWCHLPPPGWVMLGMLCAAERMRMLQFIPDSWHLGAAP